jgi:hypothetical protein
MASKRSWESQSSTQLILHLSWRSQCTARRQEGLLQTESEDHAILYIPCQNALLLQLTATIITRDIQTSKLEVVKAGEFNKLEQYCYFRLGLILSKRRRMKRLTSSLDVMYASIKH